MDAAHGAVGPDTIAKFLFTSGSTKQPKAVITTQRMLCANQQQMLQCFPVLGDEPPVLVDWLPWNHTFGGNHNVGMVLYNGGTLYIDDGKPTPALIGRDAAQPARDRADGVLQRAQGLRGDRRAMEADDALRARCSARVKMFFFAGAGLAQPVWDQLDRARRGDLRRAHSHDHRPGHDRDRTVCDLRQRADVQAGHVGLPAPGWRSSWCRSDGKLEVRYRGPNVTPGYWRAPEQTAEGFDDEGFYCSGDALKLIDAAQPAAWLAFDGRIAEDFKLVHRHLRQRRPAARARSSPPATRWCRTS